MGVVWWAKIGQRRAVKTLFSVHVSAFHIQGDPTHSYPGNTAAIEALELHDKEKFKAYHSSTTSIPKPKPRELGSARIFGIATT